MDAATSFVTLAVVVLLLADNVVETPDDETFADADLTDIVIEVDAQLASEVEKEEKEEEEEEDFAIVDLTG